MVCVSAAGAFIAGAHYVAVDLPQQQNLQAPTNDGPIPFGTQPGRGCYLYQGENACCYDRSEMVNSGTNYCCHDASGKTVAAVRWRTIPNRISISDNRRSFS